MPAIDEQYKNSICEIKTIQNDLLTTGRIYSVTEDTIEFIHPEDDKMPLLPYNMPVKISVFNARMGFRMLMGTVYISTDIFLRVAGIKSVQDFERRGFFRLPVRMPTHMYPIVEQQAPGEEPPMPVSVQLEDISLSGVQISTPIHMNKGETFSLEVQLFKKKMMFHCRVNRLAREENGRRYYGCSFFDHTERQMDDLCYDLFQLQRMEMRKRKVKA